MNKSPQMPFMGCGVLDAKKIPNFITYCLVIAINSTSIAQLICKGHYLHFVCSRRKSLNRFFLAKPPTFFTALALKNNIGLRLHKTCHPFTEFPLNILERYFRIFNSIMQYRRRQKFLVVSHSGGNGHRLHRVDYVGKALSLAFRTLMGPDRKNNSLVKNRCVHIYNISN